MFFKVFFNFILEQFIFVSDFILIFYWIFFLDLFCFSISSLNILFHLIFLSNLILILFIAIFMLFILFLICFFFNVVPCYFSFI
jgi:hypothetical protein